MTTRTLYHTPLHPYSRKIRVLLKEKKLDFELVDEPVWERRENFFKLNPAGEVPVFIDENGLTISGSYAIGEYIDEAYDSNHKLIGETLEERAEIRRLITWFDIKFYQEVSQYILFEKVYRRLMNNGTPDSSTIRIGKQNILCHLDYISYLTKDNTFLAGDKISLADITAAAHLSSLDYLSDVPWENSPRAKEWYAIIKSRPSFRPLLLDRIRGFRPPSHYDNPDF